MLGGALCHLLPDASEAMGSESYPISFCIAGVGYMLTMAMESIAMQLIERVSGNHAHGDQQHSQGCAQQVKHKTISQEVSDQSDATRNVIDIVQLGQRHNFHGDTDESSSHGKCVPISNDQGLPRTIEPVQSHQGKFTSALILGIALSYHSALTGTAIGSQSTLVEALNLMGVVLAHKLMESFALGSSLVTSHASPSKYWGLTLLYSASLPIGVLTSTFLYVGINEVLSPEMADPSHRLKKLASMFIGFTIMAVLPLLES